MPNRSWNEASAEIATITTNGSVDRASVCAKAGATGANSAVVAASDMSCVTTATIAKMRSKIFGFHPSSAFPSQPAKLMCAFSEWQRPGELLLQ